MANEELIAKSIEDISETLGDVLQSVVPFSGGDVVNVCDALVKGADGLQKIAKAIENLCFVIQDKKFEVTTYDGDL